jgi:hypothetical protein
MCNELQLFWCILTNGPPLWSSGQSSSLQVLRSGFDSRRYQIFWEVVGLERGPLSLLSTTKELFQRKSSSSGPEIREYDRRDQSRWPYDTLYPQKLALASPTSGGRSVGMVRWRTQAMEFSFSLFWQMSLHISNFPGPLNKRKCIFAYLLHILLNIYVTQKD